jgi:hypothetical protein
MWPGRAGARVVLAGGALLLAACAASRKPSPHPRIVLVPMGPDQHARVVSPPVCKASCPHPQPDELLVGCANADASERELKRIAPTVPGLLICEYKERGG